MTLQPLPSGFLIYEEIWFSFLSVQPYYLGPPNEAEGKWAGPTRRPAWLAAWEWPGRCDFVRDERAVQRLPIVHGTRCPDRSCPAASWWNLPLLLSSKCTQLSVMSYVTQGRYGLVLQEIHAFSLGLPYALVWGRDVIWKKFDWWIKVDCMRGIWDGIRDQICKPFKEPRDRFPTWRAGTTILSDVPARQATKAGGIDSLELISGLLKGLQIRALEF